MYKQNTDTLLPKEGLPLVLASTSPRRQTLLAQASFDFDVLAVDTDERQHTDEPANAYLLRMVAQKACAAKQMMDFGVPTLILTADTIGVLLVDNFLRILTKPLDKKDAFAMWRLMSDNTHEVWTAVQASIIHQDKIIWHKQIIDKTLVHFIRLDETQMAAYWATGEPHDKAGGYAIQGLGRAWVRAIDGDYNNVVGLPVAKTVALIKEANQWH